MFVDINAHTATHVANVRADEIWFNPGDDRVYFGGFLTSPVGNGLAPYNFIGNLPWTGSFTPPPSSVIRLRLIARTTTSLSRSPTSV